MANDLNRCEFIGRFGNPPELSVAKSGKTVAKFSIAVGSQWKENGQKQEATEWVRCVAFDKLADIIGQYCGKGSRVYLSGKMQTRKWQDQSGQDRYSTEIIANEMQLLDSKEPQAQSAPQQPRSHRQQAAPTPAPIDDWDNDIPF